jgi:pilus assembly protein CpaC
MIDVALVRGRQSRKRFGPGPLRVLVASLLIWNMGMTGGVAVAADEPSASSLAQIVDALRPDLAKVGNSESLLKAKAALELVADMKLPQASQAINSALQLDAQNTHLHFFNGLVYHLQARQGDTDKTNLAIEGYQQAIRSEPNNWLAHEFLGLAFVEQRQYGRAQAEFAKVLISRPNDVDTLQRMMAASYMSGDAATACAMADQILEIKARLSSLFLRASVSVYASCAEFDKSDAQRGVYAAKGAASEDLARLDLRTSNWRAFHKSQSKLADAAERSNAGGLKRLMQFPAPGSDPGLGAPPMGASPFGAPPMGAAPFGAPAMGAAPFGAPAMGAAPAGGQNRMVLVDVVMVRTEDTTSTTKGVNLLSALSLQFGKTGLELNKTMNNATGSVTSDTTVFTGAIGIPQLNYSLNIANANSSLNEVLARPTLAALEGMRSEFFSGTSLNAAVVSGGAGGAGSAVSIEKRYGVKLAVSP